MARAVLKYLHLSFTFTFISILWMGFVSTLQAAPEDRITRPLDSRVSRPVSGNLHRLAQRQFDQGRVDPGMQMHDVTIMFKPSAAQQAELDRLLTDQQNPSSPQFHKWLTPEEFGNRFGVSAGDQSKVVAWLNSEGLTVGPMGRGRNWVSFSGTAAQVSNALHTSLHRFQVNGEAHFANTSEPEVPEALAGR